MASSVRISLSEQLYFHIALPRNVPGHEDSNTHRIEEALMSRMLNAVTNFSQHVPSDVFQHIRGLKESLLACQTLNVDGSIGQSALLKEFRIMDNHKVLILHLSIQNCALLIYKHTLDSGELRVVFEAFETSATCEKVLASKNALQWDFPGCAVSISLATFSEPSFQEGLTRFVEQASTEYIPRFAATTYKAATPIQEIRDTSDPSLISGLLMTILEANGAVLAIPQLRKRVRDTVVFKDARKPWRRLPFYLVLRVTTQRYLYRLLGPQTGRLYYKWIISMIHAQLLEDILKRNTEAAYFLRQKLGRRLAKLESDAARDCTTTKGVHYHLMQSLGPGFEATLVSSGNYQKSLWRAYKQPRERSVPTLRPRPHENETMLRLANSAKTLRGLLVEHIHPTKTERPTPAKLLERYENSVTSVKPYMETVSHHISLSKYHKNVIIPTKSLEDLEGPRCEKVAQVIQGYARKIHSADEEHPGLKSHMLLYLMELWVLMDKDAVTCYPLLNDYHPGFGADILDPIHLDSLEDMKRARDVRVYLERRYYLCSNQQNKTIFDDPADDCFAVKYYDTVDNLGEFLALREEIEDCASRDRSAKEDEREAKSQHHEDTINKRNGTECVYDTIGSWDGTTHYKHREPCDWHDLNYEAKSIRIRIFEHPLPNYEPAAKAALFELNCPQAFAAYRDATWYILSTLGLPPIDGPDRISLIREYVQLRPYANQTVCQVTLGSHKKAHLESHYSTSGFPIALGEVLRTCGLKPRYYDRLGNTWTGAQGKASFWHHFPLKLPLDSPYRDLELSYAEWPTSNEVQASQASCPEGLSVHEFTAWQGLLVGSHSRWLNLLREMGSTNLNFSSESTRMVVLRLVQQQGPASMSDGIHTDVHSALLDDALCAKLLGQVRYRLETLQQNWREHVQMEILLTILLKIASSASSTIIQDEASALLSTVRSITNRWRNELQAIVTEDAKIVHSAIWASLLCKLTLRTHHRLLLRPEALRQYIDASISLQYNLTGQFQSLPYNMRMAITETVLFAYEHRSLTRKAILAQPQTLIEAVDALWGIPDGYKAACLEHVPNTWWILLKVDSTKHNPLHEDSHSHSVHYNYVYGTLLVDGQEMSTLPLAYRSHSIYVLLFGSKNPIVCPSLIPGMSFAMSEPMKFGHRIHLGFRNGNLIVRACQRDRLLEFIPRVSFGSPQRCDIPIPLIEGCFHWLDIYSGHMEIRQKDPWSSKMMNWWLRWHPSGFYQAIRQHGDPRATTLLEPGCDLARSVARVFINFEYPSQIVIFVSMDGKVTVELKRLELSFIIDEAGMLLSRRLGAIVMPNQDAGTWYGLRSKILIQSVANRRQKSLLVPWGNIRVTKDEAHVAVEIEQGRGIYLKYDLNEVLGRIDCPPEPKLLYLKALLHAYTSYYLPDPLTKRTGTEEALYLLQTGSHQPWSPLSIEEVGTLNRIADLSPQREYYPKDAKCMETISWNPQLTVPMQDDRYRPLVAKILRRSLDLSNFFLDSRTQPVTDLPTGNLHLETRAVSYMNTGKLNEDTKYEPRDGRTTTVGRCNVSEVTKLLVCWRLTFSEEPSLISLLHDAPVIGGYDKCFSKCLLTDHLAVDVKAEWGALAQRSLRSTFQNRHELMFLFGTIAFSDDVNMDLLRVLLSFAVLPGIGAIEIPQYPVYFHFRADGVPPVSYLVSFLEKAKKAFPELGFKKRSQLVIAENNHEKQAEESCQTLALLIQQQWPAPEIDAQKLSQIDAAHIDITKALAEIQPEWTRLTRNHELTLYLAQVEQVLMRSAVRHITSALSNASQERVTVKAFSSLYPVRMRDKDNMPLAKLLETSVDLCIAPKMTPQHFSRTTSFNGAPPSRLGILVPRPINIYNPWDASHNKKLSRHYVQKSQTPEIAQLRTIAASLADPTSFVQRRYAEEFHVSIDALETHINSKAFDVQMTHRQVNTEAIVPAKNHVVATWEHIRFMLQAMDPQSKWLELVDLWPRLTTVELLTELAATSGTIFGPGMRQAVVAFGLAITELQRLLRIQDAQKRGKFKQEQEELANQGHTNWEAIKYPDWLLIEIDGDFLIREEQVQVALATVSPESGQNSVLQLLMGKGKTSCIIPMVAAILANGKNLARIVVPRPLLLQSAQVMQARLGGLVNREIMHLPFSRKTPTNRELMHLYGKLQSKLRDRDGVIIALPEHILSFKLSGLQQLCDAQVNEASTMLKIQDWLDHHTRDVLDECDVSLAIRTQLIYPSGSQNTVDGHPTRWQVTQALLHLVKDFVSALQSHHYCSVEIVKRGDDRLPLIYFSRADAEDHLIKLLVRVIIKGQAPSILPCAEYPEDVKKDIESYISNPSVRSGVVSRIIVYFRDKQSLMRTINLLRGLFVHRIFIGTLKKRWNVQYGLNHTRAPIAVPYLAKGVPSPSAEWGHPDVAIVLTCLSYYYEGLSMIQFKEAFEQLVKTDEPSIEYEKWFPKGIEIPKELDDYATINVGDTRQLNELYQVVRFNGCLVDYFLNNFVFPKYAKTFKFKLQASGWNLFPSISSHQTRCQVTGFSGTNDSRHQLPMLVKQGDLKQLAHTNAEVPFYLLAPRNQRYIRMSHQDGTRWTELDFIKRLAQPFARPQHGRSTGQIRILLDAGAQILEHSNKNLARAWLEIDTEAAAAVYFDDDHRAWVLYRGGIKCVPLLASPFAENLDRCVVYLDESHCRGTDLKFPATACAALTLGQHLTKDALVQAAMRLRLLGQTQSVTFYAPPEVHQGILDRLPNTDDFYTPNSADVLRWVLGQTCDAIEQLEPSYFAQTTQYLHQEQARLEHPEYLRDPNARDAFLSAVRTKEFLSLKQLYEPKTQRRVGNATVTEWKPILQDIANELQQRKKSFQDRGTAVHASALEEVEIEQEREEELEVEQERENVREVQQPVQFAAIKTKRLHEDVEHMATFGRLVAGSDAYRPMFSVLSRTALGTKHAVSMSLDSNLWVSTQFTRTVEVYQPIDNYVRPCHWVLLSNISQKALIVSPEEANELIPILRSNTFDITEGSVHLIVYSAPVTRRMLHFNHLDFHTTPALPPDFKAPIWLRVELGIFSGRLYFEWDEYYVLLSYLGLDKELSVDLEKQALAKKPLTFLHEWIAMRRKGQDFEHTPMGFVTTGKPLTDNHPFFRISPNDVDPGIRPQVARHTSGGDDDGQEDEDDGEHDDEDFAPAIEHVDDSEGEEEKPESEDEESFVDALEDAE